MTQTILVLGTTGYLGGAILSAIIAAFPNANISALTRNDKNDEALKSAGVKEVLHADTKDAQAITNIASQFELVVNAADADDLVIIDALIEGLSQRSTRSSLIQISGIFVAADDKEGVADPSRHVPSDAVEADIRGFPDDAIHRASELRIFAADAAKKINGYILSPAGVFGTSSGPVRTDSTLLFSMYNTFFSHGVVIGPGSNAQPMIHVADLSDLAARIAKRALSGEDLGASPYAKYYFGSTTEVTQRQVGEAVLKALVELGKKDNTELREVTAKEALAIHPFAFAMGRNWSVKSERGLSIGWKPTHLESVLDNFTEWMRPVVS